MYMFIRFFEMLVTMVLGKCVSLGVTRLIWETHVYIIFQFHVRSINIETDPLVRGIVFTYVWRRVRHPILQRVHREPLRRKQTTHSIIHRDSRVINVNYPFHDLGCSTIRCFMDEQWFEARLSRLRGAKFFIYMPGGTSRSKDGARSCKRRKPGQTGVYAVSQAAVSFARARPNPK